jgi:hypothetical protein
MGLLKDQDLKKEIFLESASKTAGKKVKQINYLIIKNPSVKMKGFLFALENTLH